MYNGWLLLTRLCHLEHNHMAPMISITIKTTIFIGWSWKWNQPNFWRNRNIRGRSISKKLFEGQNLADEHKEVICQTLLEACILWSQNLYEAKSCKNFDMHNKIHGVNINKWVMLPFSKICFKLCFDAQNENVWGHFLRRRKVWFTITINAV